jgi:hypothetical protein
MAGGEPELANSGGGSDDDPSPEQPGSRLSASKISLVFGN